ncbi:PaaI family thioesterase [Paenibacillus sp. SC116]|uniref:PaaI family thioesterase n=1 Tax=Paenibacillus sp. SC116 TaxID=2968986 RepID=UPI00215AE096|nr:PaaI family thioesterase [Paenibacillus sp. SC116]MCR8843419.1 PaaI family thioesterase [Paenibacillus sp. SC116]
MSLKPVTEGQEKWLNTLTERARGTFWDFIGCEVIEASTAKVVLKLKVQPHHLNVIGIVHGGVLASLLDNAMGLATMLLRPHENTVTSNLNVNFVAPMKAEELVVTAEVIHQSGRSLTCTGKVESSSGVLGTIGTGTFRVVSPVAVMP